MPPPMPSHNDYVGCRLTVLTKKDIRYEGTLFDLNKKNATVSLSEVRVHGTEGRAHAEGKPEIPPSDHLFKFLIFSGNDVKDLVVLNSPDDVVQHDPAVIAVNIPPKEFGGGYHNNHSYNGSYNMMNISDNRRRGYPPRGFKRDGVGTGSLSSNVTAEELKKECETTYDFEEANKNFDKKEIAEELMKLADGNAVQSGYKPESGFYDNISNDLSWTRQRGTHQDYSGVKMAAVRPLI